MITVTYLPQSEYKGPLVAGIRKTSYDHPEKRNAHPIYNAFGITWHILCIAICVYSLFSMTIIKCSHNFTIRLFPDDAINMYDIKKYASMNRSALLQIMACRLFDAKPLSKPMLCCWILRNKLQWNFNQNANVSLKKMHLKILSANWQPSCPRGDELKHKHLAGSPAQALEWHFISNASQKHDFYIHLPYNQCLFGKKLTGWLQYRTWFII